MSEKKNNASATGKKAKKVIIQGHIFSLDFFKRNWIYVVFVMAMALAYIGNKFACQSSIQELLTLQKTDLVNAQTDLVASSAKYNSMIRESSMVQLARERHLGLSAPLDPPYELKSK
ncbi:MAG: hypothetical protein IKS64_01135 [Muribaculaceae bacterium]|nr:hypothetical protein [Muribaculaceae bacterium]